VAGVDEALSGLAAGHGALVVVLIAFLLVRPRGMFGVRERAL
jgi:branched-subunit amino acid ABC-type transport system permease component